MLLSDNGASAEGGTTGTLNEAAGWLGMGEDVEESIARIDEIGGQDAYNHYPFGWAWAGNAPLRLWKRYAWLGGVRTPLVVRWGDRLADRGGVRPQFVHAVDLYATVLDAAGIEPPETVDGVTQQPVDGTSLLPSFAAPDGRGAPAGAVLRDVRLPGDLRGRLDGGHRPRRQPVRRARRTSSAATTTTPTGGRSSTSPRTSPSRATSPTSSPSGSAGWRSCGGPRPGATRCCRSSSSRRSMAHMHPGEFPPPTSGRYAPGGGPVQESQLPALMGGFELTAYVVVPDGRRRGDHHRDRRPARRVGDVPPRRPAGRHRRHARPDRPGRRARPGAGRASTCSSVRYEPGREPRLVLAVDGADVARGAAPGPAVLPQPRLVRAPGMLVGRDRGIAVSADYTPPFAFTGTLERVELRSGRPGARPDRSAELRVALAGD